MPTDGAHDNSLLDPCKQTANECHFKGAANEPHVGPANERHESAQQPQRKGETADQNDGHYFHHFPANVHSLGSCEASMLLLLIISDDNF